MPVTDNFKDVEQATNYQKFRPRYPESLYVYIRGLLEPNSRHSLAVDVGCGSGQSTLPLAQHFDQIVGVDPSQAQVDEAIKEASALNVTNITYRVGLAEELEFLENGSVDLLTVGTALHWFNVDKFCAECSRVLRPGGFVVAYSYAKGEFRLRGTKQENARECEDFYNTLISDYGDPNIQYVLSEKYKNFVPIFEKYFSETRRDVDTNKLEWPLSLDGMKGFLKSMSMYQKYKKTLSDQLPNPLDEIFDRLKACYVGGAPEDAALYTSEITVLSGRK